MSDWFSTLDPEIRGVINNKLSKYEIERILKEPIIHLSQKELFRDACTMLKRGISSGMQELVLSARFANYYRSIPQREIDGAINNASDAPCSPRKYPSPNSSAILKITEYSQGALNSLMELSPIKNPENLKSEEIIDKLFLNTNLICFGNSTRMGFTGPREQFRNSEHLYPLIVPNPMSSVIGTTKDGRSSSRTLNNVQYPLKHLVVEFDSGTLDEQASVIKHLSDFANLKMVVFSGSKSLHSWFEASTDIENTAFLRYAAYLGADTATFTACQFVRTPNSIRENCNKQEVKYL